MFATFIPEHLRGWFGDVLCKKDFGCGVSFMDDDYIWGTRHYWYYWMMVSLFLLALANLIVSITKLVTKNYDTSKW
jgi:hypothetical protein